MEIKYSVKEIHEKIISTLKIKGPSLPIQIAKELGMSSLFVSAFLSELAGEKRIKISNLKVGGSPLYFLEGQESRLEGFHNFLHPTEASAFFLLKEKKILKDSEQQPAIRVALRAIRDFAVGFKFNDEIYWRFYNIKESEIEELLRSSFKTRKLVERVEKSKLVVPVLAVSAPAISTVSQTVKVKKTREIKEWLKEDLRAENPLILPEKPKKQKPKSEFVLKIMNFINKNKWQVIEEKDYKTKEYNCIIQIRSELGVINFLTQAKDKKSISESDLKKLISDSQKIPLPAFMLYTGKISKKAEDFLNKYKSILKVRRVE